MYTCKDCQYYTWSNEDLEVKCKRGVNIDELYRVNNHRLTRRKCKKYKRKEGRNNYDKCRFTLIWLFY